MNNKKICLILVSLVIISFSISLYHIDFSIPPTSDDSYGYVLRSFSIINGDLSEPPRKTIGWPAFLSIFYSFFDSSTFLDYVNAARLLSMIISSVSIFPMYLLARKFFNQNISIVASCMFAFEPHLLYNSTHALSESIFIFLTILASNFILDKKHNWSSYISFMFVGLAVWMRFNGLVTIIILTIVFILTYKTNKKNLLKYCTCLVIFLIVISPMLLQKNEQYENPFYFSQTNQFFTGNYMDILSENTKNVNYTASDFINEYGIDEFTKQFIIDGITNIIKSITQISFPYLILFLPFGIILSFRHSGIQNSLIGSLWVMLLGSLSIFIIYFSIMPDKRLIYHTFPFLIIFSTLFIHKIINNGLSTFSFSQKQKNIVLVSIVIFLLILSCTFTLRYDSPSNMIYEEKLLFTETISKKFKGNIVDAGNTLEFLKFSNLNSSPENFKSFKTENQEEFFKNSEYLNEIILSAKSLEELIEIGKTYNLDYIAVNDIGVEEELYPFLSDIYSNEQKYPILQKVFDSKILNLQNFNAKIFKINYEILNTHP